MRKKIKGCLAVLYPGGIVRHCNIETPQHEPWYIYVEGFYDDGLKIDGDDLFECLLKFRRLVEVDGAIALCNGARRDVFPSGMSRQMSGGRLAYVVRIGEAARRENLVDIFAAAQAGAVTTVEQQKEYYEKWIKSFQVPKAS